MLSDGGSFWRWVDTGLETSPGLMDLLEAEVNKVRMENIIKQNNVKVNPYFLGERK